MNKETLTFEVVINVEYGGFCLDQEMADWLQRHRGWRVSQTIVRPGVSTSYDLQRLGVDMYMPTQRWGCRHDSVEFRSNFDLIACVRALRASLDDQELTYAQRLEHKALHLKVVTVNTRWSIDDVNDGKESVGGSVSASEL